MFGTRSWFLPPVDWRIGRGGQGRVYRGRRHMCRIGGGYPFFPCHPRCPGRLPSRTIIPHGGPRSPGGRARRSVQRRVEVVSRGWPPPHVSDCHGLPVHPGQAPRWYRPGQGNLPADPAGPELLGRTQKPGLSGLLAPTPDKVPTGKNARHGSGMVLSNFQFPIIAWRMVHAQARSPKDVLSIHCDS